LNQFDDYVEKESAPDINIWGTFFFSIVKLI